MPDNLSPPEFVLSTCAKYTVHFIYQLCGESFASSEQATANNVNASLGIQIGTMSRREF